MRFHFLATAAAATLGAAVVTNADSSSSSSSANTATDPYAAGRDRYERKLQAAQQKEQERRMQRGSGGTTTTSDSGTVYGGNGGQQIKGGSGGMSGNSDGLDGNGEGGGPDAQQNQNLMNMGVSVATGPGGYAGGTQSNWNHGGGENGGYNGPPPGYEDGDYNIRFNKTPFLSNYDPDNSLFPLVRTSFPVTEPLIDVLKTQTSCPSVTGLDDYEVLLDVMDLIENGDHMNGFPTHPTSDHGSAFWPHFQHVLEIQTIRRADENADAKDTIGMPLPEIWENYSLKMVADAVHDEYPNYHQSRNLADMLAKGGVAVDNNVIPKRSTAQFLRGPILMADMNTWATGLIGPHSFAAKYAVGRSRPEEIFWAIYQEELTLSELPASVQTAYQELLDSFSTSKSAPSACGNGKKLLEFDLVTDFYPFETTFHTLNSAGTSVFSGNYANVDEELCLPANDCYTFTIYDSWGDGICCWYGEGSYKLTWDHGVIKEGGYFSHSESTKFGDACSTGAVAAGAVSDTTTTTKGSNPRSLSSSSSSSSSSSTSSVTESSSTRNLQAIFVPDAPAITAYPEGSPAHPSWPAMHSAASQTSFWLSVVLDLTPHQLCQARLVDYAVAYARTVAGVHYPDDNIDGLNLGQAVLIELLADYLVGKYGSDRDAVESKIESMKYDWNTFDVNDPCPFDPDYSG